MALGFAVWRLPPEAFWRLTPREITAVLGGLKRPAPTPLERHQLESLLQRFPDEM